MATEIHVMAVTAMPREGDPPHQESVGCWCKPVFWGDVRDNLPANDVRIYWHRVRSTDPVPAPIKVRLR